MHQLKLQNVSFYLCALTASLNFIAVVYENSFVYQHKILLSKAVIVKRFYL